MATSGIDPSELRLGHLDYDKARIVMEVETQDEANKRLTACQKEPWTTAWIESIPPEGVFYDVGANVGSYTLIAAVRGVRTVAIEPGFNNYATLCRNALRNQALHRLITFPVALANKTGLVWLDYNSVAQGGASHTLGSPTPVHFSTHRQLVQTWRLDDLIAMFHLAPPTHIKIDVDGDGRVEMAVFAGMADTLRTAGLVSLMVELPLDHEGQIREYLAGLGWEVTNRWDERGGQMIQGVAYAEFARRVVADVPDPEMAGVAA